MVSTNKGVDHKQAVAKILNIPSKPNLYCKPEKYKCLRSKVEYLGLIIWHNQIQMKSIKLKAVAKWLAPSNINTLQKFIGFFELLQNIYWTHLIDHPPTPQLDKDRNPFGLEQEVWWGLHIGIHYEDFQPLQIFFTQMQPLRSCSWWCSIPMVWKGQWTTPCGLSLPVIDPGGENYKILYKELLAISSSAKEWRHYLGGKPNQTNYTSLLTPNTIT